MISGFLNIIQGIIMTTVLLIITKIFFLILGFYCIKNAYYVAEHKQACKTILWCTLIIICAMGVIN